jgi:hypothetical protein
LSDVASTGADRQSHDQMTKFASDFDARDTFAVKLSDCLLFSEDKTFKDAVQCFNCIHNAYVGY